MMTNDLNASLMHWYRLLRKHARIASGKEVSVIHALAFVLMLMGQSPMPVQILVGLDVAPMKLRGSPPMKEGKPAKGVLVTKVHQNSPAARSGFKAGDVVTSVDGKPVTSVEEWRLAWQSFGAKPTETGKCQVLGYTYAKKWKSASVTMVPIRWTPDPNPTHAQLPMQFGGRHPWSAAVVDAGLVPKPSADATALVANLPAYRMLFANDKLGGGRFGDALVPTLSRKTPVAERERVARGIAKKERLTNLVIYSTEEACEANISASFLEKHPNALKQGLLGSLDEDTFRPGEANYP
jgi:membrane-associated protease RseP (regulator of RpoE activity)